MLVGGGLNPCPLYHSNPYIPPPKNHLMTPLHRFKLNMVSELNGSVWYCLRWQPEVDVAKNRAAGKAQLRGEEKKKKAPC